jgi:hypothetical protein
MSKEAFLSDTLQTSWWSDLRRRVNMRSAALRLLFFNPGTVMAVCYLSAVWFPGS